MRKIAKPVIQRRFRNVPYVSLHQCAMAGCQALLPQPSDRCSAFSCKHPIKCTRGHILSSCDYLKIHAGFMKMSKHIGLNLLEKTVMSGCQGEFIRSLCVKRSGEDVECGAAQAVNCDVLQLLIKSHNLAENCSC